MSSQKYLPAALDDAPYLQPPPGRRYVRSFLFSRRVDAPLAQIHLIARVLLVLCLSAAQLRTMSTAHPDPVGAVLLWIPGLLIFLWSGLKANIARIYILLTLPTLLGLFISWVLFNPVPGHIVLWRQTAYSGNIVVGLALWQLIWLAIVLGYFWWRRGIAAGIVLATIVTIIITNLVVLPGWTITQISFFHPLTINITDQGALVAFTKVMGYFGMVLSTMALVVTSRDVELIGALRQLRIPLPIIFFLSIVFRALNLALNDYETIYQAQVARAVNAQPRSFLRRLVNLTSIAVPMVAMMIRRSSEIGDALLARGYKLRQQNADFYETTPFRPLDWGILVICLLLVLISVSPLPGLTALLQRGI